MSGTHLNRLQGLVEKYINSLGERQETLRALYAQISTAIDAQRDLRHLSALSDLHHDVHKLAGSAGSLGLDGLGQAAASLDVYMSAIQRRGDSFNDSDLAQFRALYQALDGSMNTQRLSESSILQAHSASGSPALGDPLDAHAPLASASDVWVLPDIMEQYPALPTLLEPFGLTVSAKSLEQLALDLPLNDLQAPPLSSVVVILCSQQDADSVARIIQRRVPVLAIGTDQSLQARVLMARAGVQGLLTPPLEGQEILALLDRLTRPKDNRPIQVVLVDDDPALSELLSYQFSNAGMTPTCLSSPQTLLETLGSIQPDVVVLDRNMPRWDGFEVAMAIRQIPQYATLPLVFLTADKRPDSRLRGLALGGDDYLHKPVDGAHLATLVRARALRARALREKIVTDGLTGLLNHAAIVHEAQHQVALAHRLKWPLCFALVDLDHFKSVNDTYGHQAGDSVLTALSRLLRQRLRRSDIIGRMGGEEFAILLVDTPIDKGLDVMNSIREAFSQIKHSINGHRFTVTLSCGISALSPVGHDGDAVPSLIRLADEALYQAKAAGRNTVLTAQSNT